MDRVAAGDIRRKSLDEHTEHENDGNEDEVSQRCAALVVLAAENGFSVVYVIERGRYDARDTETRRPAPGP